MSAETSSIESEAKASCGWQYEMLLLDNDSLELSFDVLCILALPYQYHDSDAMVRELSRLKELQWELGKNISSSRKPCIIYLVKGLKFCFDQTEIQSTQRSSLNCSCLLRSVLLSVKQVLLLGFGWVPLNVLGEVFPDTSQFVVVWSERCCVTVKTKAQPEDSGHFASFSV